MRAAILAAMGLLAGLSLPAAAASQRPVVHSVDWFIAHPAYARALSASCHPGAERSGATLECLNAGTASFALMASEQQASVSAHANRQADPAYWDNLGYARTGVLVQCAHPESVPAGGFGPPSQAVCQAAAISQARSGR